ncbi:MAG: hypothetical protein FD149_135 [Rhodospirillaceae bacterium]|nr:MAG: hypothetical protein FD149_135 [Rhodospirillaceae bacterium]
MTHGVPDRRIPARQRHPLEGPQAPRIPGRDVQQFRAPHRAIRAPSRPVQHQGKALFGPVFGKAGQGVGVVMLDRPPRGSAIGRPDAAQGGSSACLGVFRQRP